MIVGKHGKTFKMSTSGKAEQCCELLEMQPKLNAQTIISFYYLYMMSSSRDRFDFLCVEKYNSIFCNNFFPVSDIFIHHHPHLLEHQTQRGDKTTSRSLLLLNLKQGKVSKVKKIDLSQNYIFALSSVFSPCIFSCDELLKK